ncbi:rod-binding protein [uncultured Sphingomonas sp.]|uniref:rod-binding protein n=1 Tax=uncultured Sphingomonas sp. TaxID=158754 RepID=UPI0025D02B51|nr:rod-binding protein [uncultured Sphingomonas sp.]
MNDTSPLPPAALAGATTPAKPLPKVDAKNAKTAQEFESVFLGQMTQLMMQSVQQDEQFSGGNGEEIFRGMLAEKLGAAMARRGGIGLAPAVLDQILKLQQGQK